MKEKLFNIARFSMIIVALVQLALSQIHIGIITKVFASEVGFWLFLFIIFGVVVAFNSINLKSSKTIIIDIIGVIAVSISGVKYVSLVVADLNLGNVLTIEESRLSIYFSIASICIYIIGMIVVMLTKEKRVKNEEV